MQRWTYTARPLLAWLALALGAAVAGPACEEPGGDDDSSATDDDDDGVHPADLWTLGTVIDTEGRGVLAQMEPTPWGEPLWLIRVEGSHHEMGYQYGRLLGPTVMDLWWTYLGVIGEEMGDVPAEDADFVLGGVLDLAWEHFAPHIPQTFDDEMQGMADGMADAGIEYGDGPEDLIKVPRRIVTLIDLAMSSQLDFSNIGGLFSFLQDGYTQALLEYYGREGVAPPAPPPEEARLADLLRRWDATHGAGAGGPLLQCSYFAAWGDRTADGALYATRNMDFTTDSGLNTHASVAAFVPDDGVAHASISWVGANLGALAGISAEGIAIAAVGASSPYERARTEPQILKAREVLQGAHDLDDAMKYLTNDVGDDVIRAPTIGYNALAAWGDPRGGGADAQAAILETNGLEIGVFHHRHDCSVEASLVRFDYDGNVESIWTPDDHPDWVNAEADAVEIDAAGQPRLFAHDGEGNLLTDGNGHYIPDPDDGLPLRTGYPEDCALYRGDEAMNYAVRVHQTAANGPADGGDGLMVDSGSYRERYWPMREMTRAYAAGTAYSWEGEEVIADHGGTPVPIGLDETEAVSRVAAMDSNVWDVVYDTTHLVIRVSYESGAGDTWQPASGQPSYLEIDLHQLFLLDE